MKRKHLSSAILQCNHSLPRKDYENAFKDWLEDGCISVEGEYFKEGGGGAQI